MGRSGWRLRRPEPLTCDLGTLTMVSWGCVRGTGLGGYRRDVGGDVGAMTLDQESEGRVAVNYPEDW